MRSKRIAIRDQTAEANLFARRTFIAFIIVITLMVMLFNNLYSLQVVSHEKYQTRSNQNRIKIVPVAPNRGLIYDRNGVLLAENKPVFSLELIPEEIDDIHETITQLQQVIDISEDEIKLFERDLKRSRRFQQVSLKTRLTQQEVAAFSVNQHRFPGVEVAARLKRFYPYGELFTHSLGYVAKINRNDIRRLDENNQSSNYAATYDIGKQGIERFYEEALHGKVGYEEVEVNSRGKVIRSLNLEAPIPGKDITLTLDIGLQQIAKQSLGDNNGAVVVIDPRNGEVLTLYSNPSYDPNLFVHGISINDYNALLSSNKRPLINRTTQGRYPPASTIKPHLGILGLEENEITATSKIWDPGFFQLENVKRRFRDHVAWGHGWVDLDIAMAKSCDTYFYHLANVLGIDKISNFMAHFGFGEYSGLDIHEETDAILPSRGWKRARYNQPWYVGDTISIGIGQGYWSVTPIQLAHSVAILANSGRSFVPHLRQSPLDESEINNIVEKPPLTLKNPKNWQIIHDSMVSVVNDGSAKQPFLGASYPSAGKTGTAQVIGIAEDEEYDASKLSKRFHDNAMYVGYAPVDEPEIVVTVVLENAGGGGANAAPVARKIMDHYFQRQAEQP